MRRGLSLVEMMIAIILFGVLSIVGFKYYKNFMNTTLSGQKARVSALINQAQQLSDAYDIYHAQFGVTPTSEENLTAGNALILEKLPDGIKEIAGTTAASWDLNTSIDLDGGATSNNDIAFTYPINTGVTADDLQYCNIVNNFANPSLDLNASSVETSASAEYGTGLHSFFCYDSSGDGTQIVFVKFINPN